MKTQDLILFIKKHDPFYQQTSLVLKTYIEFATLKLKDKRGVGSF